MEEQKVSIIIPNFNGRELLQKNLPKVIKASKKSEVIVVDDGSTDGSVAYLEKEFTEIKVIAKKKNAGFSSACNTAVQQAKGRIVVLLNTDLYPDENFLAPLVAHFKDDEVFAVGCLEKDNVLRGRGEGYFKDGFFQHRRGEVNKKYTLWASGGSAAFSKEKWNQLDGFDELYNPFYWEDIDLCYRALKRGWKVFFEKDSVVYHQHAQGAIKKTYHASYIEAIAFRNQLIFMWKNLSDRDLLIEHIFWLPTHLVRFIVTGKEPFLRGFLLALGKLPWVLVKRFKNKNLLTDREVCRRATL